ncbi:XRRA1 protein, partial [Galbula dea]|nr:XRRA1 protein [Galbula dea]
MATTGLDEVDYGSYYATNCFPARNILCANKEGAGHWLLPHRGTLRVWKEKGTPKKTPQQRRKPLKSTSMEGNKEHNVLDEAFLMKHHCLKNPSDLCSVNISSQSLVSAKEDDFEKFGSVVFINAAENRLPLEPFGKFPGLKQLELSLNGLRNLKVTAGDFLHLEDLDLSYNHLTPQDVWALGDLSQLRVLHLTGNELQSLPPDLAGSWDSAHIRFPSLEVLSLDDNHLSDPNVFVSLSHLCSLRELNLDRNRISAVPYLHQAENRKFFLHPALDGNSFRAEWYKSLSSFWQQPQTPQQEDREVPAELEAKKGQHERDELQEKRDPARPGVSGAVSPHPCPPLLKAVPREGEPSTSKTLPAPSMCRDVHAPFPQLKHLSLAFNKITEETSLLPVAFFPCLKELIFHNNPLATNRRGQPPLLTWLLQHNLGIRLVPQQSLAPKRRHFSIPLRASHKGMREMPQEPKLPRVTRLGAPAKILQRKHLLAAGEAERDAAPPSPAQQLVPVSSMAPSSSWEMVLGEGGSRPPPVTAEEDTASFFMTQTGLLWRPFSCCFEVEDVPSPLQSPVAEGRLGQRSEQREERSSQLVPEQYRGYEELLGGDTDPDFIEPVGIQKNVQALHYLLKHPLVYRDTKPRLGSLQKPFVPQRKLKRMPDPPAPKTRAEILDEILVAMRNTSTITEIPLASVLQKRRSSSKEYQEALRLMEEFQGVFE